jgi:hypothetical protein
MPLFILIASPKSSPRWKNLKWVGFVAFSGPMHRSICYCLLHNSSPYPPLLSVFLISNHVYAAHPVPAPHYLLSRILCSAASDQTGAGRPQRQIEQPPRCGMTTASLPRPGTVRSHNSSQWRTTSIAIVPHNGPPSRSEVLTGHRRASSDPSLMSSLLSWLWRAPVPLHGGRCLPSSWQCPVKVVS